MRICWVLVRSETRATAATWAMRLSNEFKSTSSVVTQGALVIRPIAIGETVIEADVIAPTGRSARRHVTMPLACEQVPEFAVALMNTTPGGSESVSVTLVARLGPLLDTSRL